MNVFSIEIDFKLIQYFCILGPKLYNYTNQVINVGLNFKIHVSLLNPSVHHKNKLFYFRYFGVFLATNSQPLKTNEN